MRLLLVALLLVPLQDRKAYTEAMVRVNTHFWEGRLDLADWCRQSGLHREARGHYQFLIQNGGTNPYAARSKTALKGAWSSKPNSATPDIGKTYRERLEEYFKDLGSRAWRVHVAADKAKLKKEADDWLEKTLLFYLDHPEARLKRGEERVEPFGWVSKVEAEQARKAVDLKDDLSAQDDSHRTWDKAWIIRSPHFVLRTTMGNREAARTLELLEKARTVFFATLGTRMKPFEYPVGLYIFSTAADIDAAKPKAYGSYVGYFNPVTNLSYLNAGDENTLLHELTHQLAHNAMGHETWSLLQQADVRSDSPDNYWVMEGLAVYFGGLKFEESGPVFRPTARRGDLEPPALREFLGYDHTAFSKNPGYCYAVSGELTRFFMEAGGGKRRDAFLDFVSEYYSGNSTLETLEKSLGIKIPDLQKEFTAWLQE